MSSVTVAVTLTTTPLGETKRNAKGNRGTQKGRKGKKRQVVAGAEFEQGDTTRRG